MRLTKKTGLTIDSMSDDEFRKYIKPMADYVKSIVQEEGESYIDFVNRMAKLLGWGTEGTPPILEKLQNDAWDAFVLRRKQTSYCEF